MTATPYCVPPTFFFLFGYCTAVVINAYGGRSAHDMTAEVQRVPRPPYRIEKTRIIATN